MTAELDFKHEYLPFSEAATRAEQLVLDNQYREALEQIDEMWDMVQQKIEDG